MLTTLLTPPCCVTFKSTPPSALYPLSLHDALPISIRPDLHRLIGMLRAVPGIEDISLSTNGVRLAELASQLKDAGLRSEEHTSELQSPCNLVCRLLLEKKKNPHITSHAP